MGFGDKWMKWMELLVFNSSMLVLVNGSPTKVFDVHKGLRQGDLLSPFLFVLVAEGFNPRKEATWNPLVLKMKNRLEGWTNRFLNLGGRITLLKSVLSSLAIFTMSFFKSRYGDLTLYIFGDGKDIIAHSSCSLWWKDMIKIGSSSSYDPIVVNSRFSVHNGLFTPFWESTWLDKISLKEEFPKLFEVSSLKRVMLGEAADANKLEELLGRLEDFDGWKDGRDSLIWCGNSGLAFSVAPCYEFSDRLRILYGPPNKCDSSFGLL
ncbi:uncharacterized protein LOC131658524 [Vicia villosa]|uniref:uncharacterized protein LOC131658524 n=1 Tax=Vicia villosa TaxID=3911 RepID=UPI00273ADCEA|nr:uncharacterized protein LOC131658524 [Vicia villosa]